MSKETRSFAADPFISAVQEMLSEGSAGIGAREIERIRGLASTMDTDFSAQFKSPQAGRNREGTDDFDREDREYAGFDDSVTYNSQWFERWLTFDPEHREEIDVEDLRPRRPNSTYPQGSGWRSGLKIVSSNIALIDRTTIDLASTHFENGEPPNALGILDLAKFVENMILREELYVLGSSLGSASSGRSIFNEVRKKGFTERDRVIVGSTLLWINELAGNDTRFGSERREALRIWKEILEGEPSREQMFSVGLEDALLYLNARPRVDGDSPAMELINELYELFPGPDVDPARRIAAARAANCRALLNLEAARHLGIPYAGGITRLPMKRLLWSRGRRADALLGTLGKGIPGKIPEHLDSIYRRKISATLADNERTVMLPVFLAVIISRIDNLGQFFECVDDLRSEAEPLRRRIQTLEQALDSGESAIEIKRLVEAFGDDCRVLRRTVWDLLPAASAVFGVILTAATGQPLWLTTALALMGAGEKTRHDTWARLRNRIWRRDLWFITRLGQVADELSNVTDRLESLWGPYYSGDEFVNRLDGLRSLKSL